MKLAYVEVAGFRGFKDSTRFDFPAGFVVLTGRNGVGKSTILDAIARRCERLIASAGRWAICLTCRASPVKANHLAEPVKAIADPQGRGRQYLATFLSGLAGTHAAGFVLTRQERPACGPTAHAAWSGGSRAAR
jgi:hypothetical protein